MTEALNIEEIWNLLIPEVEKSLTKPIYETLLTSARPTTFKDGTLEIAVPQDVIKQWLSSHCLTILEEEAKALNSNIKKLIFVVGPRELFTTPELEEGYSDNFQETVSREVQKTYLNHRYTFDTFVIGAGNRFAHAAAKAVAESPATAYNPLFLYGGVGLGKTHLMQAVGHEVLKKLKNKKVLYITCEMFTNELINAIRNDSTARFRDKYRNIDILMVDDIQFLAKKEATQEEFFHTFNALHSSNKQIIVSSDRPPKEIPTLEDRLRSRFEWGLTADLQPPDFETRIAILRKKAEFIELVIPNDILTYIASRVESNIRELEGALIKVVAFASLSSSEISFELVEKVLKDISTSSKGKNSFSIDLIKKATADYYSVKIDEMSAKIRTKNIALARQVAMYLVREMTNSSLPKIGEEFGGRDHTTVMHACEKITKARKTDEDVRDALKEIELILKKK
ncbi:chromosomal replication initiation protein DnaA [candidate division WOR-1 bacterium RIFOXYA12_FULL_43_27]|uniref:Chromosomal replication initiator protein DnaA n=1 Tax=candidate division WOR-1 bacterium RIFOXYC2_FULL_46_14 TaxID=1802587 RepID=A0A1F4U4I5_UNCSA|nr:MAG: chromosomal replication initiation protein DnaA [candidate division WOR-1 bacterium RIFOXYA12_FULL_43_27]OGC20794.1 MAG: chromosomal replication initiation protein DnaA [candidate division WOR-1 bacterium RIFOXYB2_FULL_46_45]OGC31469.1 MAG: chromosomal replication initiation protein DnaA [candidate division WOR-1 bacterium RIFOXYA2_FULL_46_56]OGC39874.1 MAG: chromosomal replication initiation protein DnaA [candidate division WOR-1 bacterium RIFOXYC2_FULL_46_14]